MKTKTLPAGLPILLSLVLTCLFISCDDAGGGCGGVSKTLETMMKNASAPAETPISPAAPDVGKATKTAGAVVSVPETQAGTDEVVVPASTCEVSDCEEDDDCPQPLTCNRETHCCQTTPLPRCGSPCGTDDDCAEPLVCNLETYCCESPPPEPEEAPALASCETDCDEYGLCPNFLTCNGETRCCETPVNSCGGFPACDQPEVSACGGCDGCSGGDWTCNTGTDCCEAAVVSECSVGGTLFCCGVSDCPAGFQCTSVGPFISLCLNASPEEPQCPRLIPPPQGMGISCVAGGQGVCDAAFPLVGPTVCSPSGCCVP